MKLSPKPFQVSGKIVFFRVYGALFVVWVVMWLYLRKVTVRLLLSILTRPNHRGFMNPKTNNNFFYLDLNRKSNPVTLNVILLTLLTLLLILLTLELNLPGSKSSVVSLFWSLFWLRVRCYFCVFLAVFFRFISSKVYLTA